MSRHHRRRLTQRGTYRRSAINYRWVPAGSRSRAAGAPADVTAYRSRPPRERMDRRWRWRCITPREIVYQLLTGGRIERTVATRPGRTETAEIGSRPKRGVQRPNLVTERSPNSGRT